MADASITSKAKIKKIKKACRLCGRTRNLTVTECCNNWICEDKYNMRVGDYGCYRDHRKYSSCNFHYNNKHEKKMQDCEECIDLGSSEYDILDVTCVSCGFMSHIMENFAFQLNDDFYCTKDECQAKGKPPVSKNTKKRAAEKEVNSDGVKQVNTTVAKKVSKAAVRKVRKPVAKKVKRACRSCGKTKKLTKTECCNNWICNDEHKYRLFSFALNSCYRNHHRYSSCTHHFNEKHEGKWQDCEKCKENVSGVCSDFDDVICVSCGFKSETMENFAFQVKKDFYCKKAECQKQGKLPPSKSTMKKVEVKKVSRVVVNKVKKACRLCKKNRKLTKTECCNNWICENKYNWRYGDYGCSRDHERYSICNLHYIEKHEGKWQDCEECVNQGPMDYDLEDLTCVSCGFKSQTSEDFAFQLNDDFYCTKEECQAKGKSPPSKNIKRKSEVEEMSLEGMKKAKRVCRLCGKIKKLTKTECCDSWVCDDSNEYRSLLFDLNSCYRKHHKYSCCAFHHTQEHEGKAQDCEKCKELGTFQFDFNDFKTDSSNVGQENVKPENVENMPKNFFMCVCCGYKSETVEAFAFQLNDDFYCTNDECQKKGKPPS